MAVFVPPHPGASTPINTSTWDTETALHGFVYIQTLPRQCRQRESMITAVALPPLPLDSTTLLAPRYIRITMSSYNPYVSAVQAETPRAIVTQEESNATSAASMYDEPPPSYSELDSTVVGPGHSHLSGHDCGLPSIGSPTTSASPHVVSMQATPPSLPPRPSPKDGTMYPAPYEPPPASTPHPPPRTNRAFSESSQIPTCSVRGTQAHRAPEGPPAFRRETSRVVPYGPFETIRVPGMGPRLGDGFVTTLPFSATQPHPFSTHDVTEDEWQHFLRDVKRAGAHSAQGLASASPLPAMLGRGILTGFFCQAIADSKRESAQQGSASIYEVIQSWNQSFFSKRNIEVALEGDANSELDHANSTIGFGRGGLLGRRERLLSFREEHCAARAQLRGGQVRSRSPLPYTSEKWCLVVRYRPVEGR